MRLPIVRYYSLRSVDDRYQIHGYRDGKLIMFAINMILNPEVTSTCAHGIHSDCLVMDMMITCVVRIAGVLQSGEFYSFVHTYIIT